MDESTTKRCFACERHLARTEFQRNARMADGLQNECKTCRAKRQREYRARNRDHVNALGRAAMQRRRAANPDREREYMRLWRQSNPELVREARRTWESENYDKVRAYSREANLRWKRANPELVKAEDLRRRALKRAAEVGDVDLDALWIAQDGLCGLCGNPIDRSLRWPDPMSASVDHIIPLAKGGSHSQENLQWAHLIENIRKGARLLD